mgnify:CR=1 FL=1
MVGRRVVTRACGSTGAGWVLWVKGPADKEDGGGGGGGRLRGVIGEGVGRGAGEEGKEGGGF